MKKRSIILVLSLLPVLATGCAFEGGEAADDNGQTGTTEQGQAWGVREFKIPPKKLGNNKRRESGSCETTVLASDFGGGGTPESVAELRCVSEITAEECAGGTRTLDGIRWMHAECEENEDGDFDCEADVGIECVFQAS